MAYTKTIIHLSVSESKYPSLFTSTSVNNCEILLPHLLKDLWKLEHVCVLVVTPLVSIMKDQVEDLTRLGLRALATGLGDKKEREHSLMFPFNHKNYNFLDCDWFKKLTFSPNFTCQVVIGQFVIG